MSQPKNWRATLLALSVLLLVGGLWWWARQADNTGQASSIPPPEHPQPVAEPVPFHQPATALAPDSQSAPAAIANRDPARSAQTAISEILRLPASDFVAIASRLAPLVLDPKVPPAQRSESLAHVLNLSGGHEADLLLPLVRDPRLALDDCRAILDDSLNRSANWQGEVYLAALGVRPEPELRARIRSHLCLLTGREDLGDDPKAWLDPLVQVAAKQNP